MPIKNIDLLQQDMKKTAKRFSQCVKFPDSFCSQIVAG
jgi:hypothetical protein